MTGWNRGSVSWPPVMENDRGQFQMRLSSRDLPPSMSFDRMRRMLRRNEFRLIVPLANTTIYEMERRGEFPRRFNLTPRCVVWNLIKVEAWIEQRRKDSDARLVSVAPSPDVRLRRTRPVKLCPQIDQVER